MDWYKQATEMYRDPKVLRLSDRTRWRWVQLLCIAGETEMDGELPPIEDLWVMVRAESEEAFREEIQPLIGKMIDDDDGVLVIRKWQDRQGVTSRDRTRKWRKKNSETVGDVTVTSHECHGDALEKRREEESREEERRQEKGASPFLISDTSPVAQADVVTTTAEISHQHEVISVWKEILHRYPPKTRWHEIVWVVQGQTIALRKLLTVWKSKKWNPTDVDGILERFRMSQAAEIDLMVAQEKKLNEAITLDQMIRRQMHANGRN
jgi:hypothetical protein